MSFKPTPAQLAEADAALIHYQNETKRTAEILARNEVPVLLQPRKGFADLTDDLRFSKGEVFIEFAEEDEYNVRLVNHRVEGYVVSFDENELSKKVGIWCTKNNELFTRTFLSTDYVQVGAVCESVYAVEQACMDCRKLILDCTCSHA